MMWLLFCGSNMAETAILRTELDVRLRERGAEKKNRK